MINYTEASFDSSLTQIVCRTIGTKKSGMQFFNSDIKIKEITFYLSFPVDRLVLKLSHTVSVYQTQYSIIQDVPISVISEKSIFRSHKHRTPFCKKKKQKKLVTKA